MNKREVSLSCEVGGGGVPLGDYRYIYDISLASGTSQVHIMCIRWNRDTKSVVPQKGCTVYQMVDVMVICGDSSRRCEFSEVYTEFSTVIQVLECLLKNTVLAVRHTVCFRNATLSTY